MSDLLQVPLSAIIESLESGVSVNGESRPVRAGELGVLKTSAVSDGRFFPNENKVIKREDIERSKKSIRKDDLLISRMNTPDLVGANGLVNEDYPNLFLPDRLWRIALSDKKRDCIHWLAFVLNSEDVRAQIKIRSTGTSNSMKNLSQEAFLGIKVMRPPLPEQIEIARILTIWDEAIRDTSRLLDAKTRLKTAMMDELLTGKTRFQEFENSPFVERKIGDVLRETTRLVTWDETQIYRLASIRRNSGGLFWREALRGDQIKVKKLHTVREGDFLISHIQAAYGAMGCVPAEFDGAHISDTYSILTPVAPDSLDMRFVDYLSQMPKMRHQIVQSSNGVKAERLRLNFDPRAFLKQPILLPATLEEQRKIADVLDGATRELRLLQTQLQKLKDQKRGLMQKLLSGEVRVRVSSSGTSPANGNSNTGGES